MPKEYYRKPCPEFGKLFYGCSNYPECSNKVWTLPIKADCPKCGYGVMCEKISKKPGKHLECPKCRHKVTKEEGLFLGSHLKKILLWNIFSFVIVISVLAISGEIFFRLFPQYISPKQGIFWDHWGNDPQKRDWYKIHYNVSYAYEPEIGFIRKGLLQINDFPYISSKQVRVMFLGDSITEKFGFADEMAKKLNENLKKTPMSFLNMATGGWGTFNERVFLEKYGIKLRPDVVILQIHINDFENNPVVLRQSDGSWLAYKSGKLGQMINQRLLQKSYFAQFLFFRYLLLFVQGPKTFHPELVEAELLKIKELAFKYHFKILPVFFPFMSKPNEVDEKLEKIMVEIGQRVGLEGPLNTRTQLNESDLSPYQFVSSDYTHPNSIMMKRMTELVLPYFEPVLNK